MDAPHRQSPYALALMAQQYMTYPSGDIDHSCMTAGEEAVEVLALAGLVHMVNLRGGLWTDLGRRFLAEGPSALPS